MWFTASQGYQSTSRFAFNQRYQSFLQQRRSTVNASESARFFDQLFIDVYGCPHVKPSSETHLYMHHCMS